MSKKCTFDRMTNRHNEVWGGWIMQTNVEDSIVQMARFALQGKYKNYWIDPIYFDDKYIRFRDDFFAEVGIALYPKITKAPAKSKGMSSEEYRALIWKTAHNDIALNDRHGVNPKYVIIKGVSIPADKYEAKTGDLIYKCDVLQVGFIAKITYCAEVSENKFERILDTAI